MDRTQPVQLRHAPTALYRPPSASTRLRTALATKVTVVAAPFLGYQDRTQNAYQRLAITALLPRIFLAARARQDILAAGRG